MLIKVSAPATSANLGPGFDCFGMALDLKNVLTVKSGSKFQIALTGSYAKGISNDESNLVWQTMLFLWQKIHFSAPSVALSLEINIPPARGLGSSSAAIAGGLLAANSLAGSPLSLLELLQVAGVVRTCLDELEKLVFERFSRECFMSAMERDANDVSELLIVLHRLFK